MDPRTEKINIAAQFVSEKIGGRKPVAGIVLLAVGGVLPPREAAVAQVVFDLLPGGGEQGTDEIAPLGGHPGQATQTAAPS